MRTFGRMKNWTRPVLDRAEFTQTTIHPGPELPDVPGSCVVWTRYGGPGEILDGTADDLSWQVRCIGRQGDYESAESIADTIDAAMLTHYSSEVGGVWVSGIRRVGGAPAALLTDESDRTHFVCSYIVSVEMALPIG